MGTISSSLPGARASIRNLAGSIYWAKHLMAKIVIKVANYHHMLEKKDKTGCAVAVINHT